ncbi:MAG: phytanoyl-CoA dioxygenase family protein [Planctomycetaceae bacterium]|nr:phytanoyl-CoA dioxygenase family protein [Planctomycetaceae bacterium]
MDLFEISGEQREEFLQKGYLVLPGAVPQELLKRWQNFAVRLEHEALESHANHHQLHGACVVEDPVGPRLMRYDDILVIDPQICLDLLACPAIMAIARELTGRGTVPLQMDVLFKHQHPHPVVKWHQDAPHSRTSPYVNVGIYLDDAPVGDGCLSCVPGTQHSVVDVAGLAREFGWNIPGAIEVPVAAGDILVHDIMLLHGSQPKRKPGVRRTVYVELRPCTGITDSGSQSERWIDLRKQWMKMVLRNASPDCWPREWRGDYGVFEARDEEIIRAIIEEREPSIPAHYGRHSAGTDEYPVPSDMIDWQAFLTRQE